MLSTNFDGTRDDKTHPTAGRPGRPHREMAGCNAEVKADAEVKVERAGWEGL